MRKFGKREPAWEDILPGMRILFAPIGLKAVRAARRACGKALEAEPDDIEGAGDELSRELITRSILEWEGVADLEGVALPVSAEAIELVLADPDAFEACDRKLVMPWVKRDAEKNASSGSPNGTSEAATPDKTIAGSPAVQRKPAAVKRARTKRTKPKATTGPKSGI